MLLHGVKQMIESNRLEYTSITSTYYGHVENFGGVKIYIWRSYPDDMPIDCPVHEEVWIRPYADTGRMDDLETYLTIPKDQAIAIYKDWCDNRDHGLDANHQALLEELQGSLALAAINHYLKEQ